MPCSIDKADSAIRYRRNESDGSQWNAVLERRFYIMENSLKGLILAAGTIITCVVISLGFYISREAKDTATNGANQINKLNSEFVESDKDIYDGTTVSGSEDLNVI